MALKAIHSQFCDYYVVGFTNHNNFYHFILPSLFHNSFRPPNNQFFDAVTSTDEEKKEAMGKRYCYEFKNRGTCVRGDECWYQHSAVGKCERPQIRHQNAGRIFDTPISLFLTTKLSLLPFFQFFSLNFDVFRTNDCIS